MAWIGTRNVRRGQWWNAQLLIQRDIDNTSTKDRLQALEQAAVTMQGEVLQARTAAAAGAEQRATDEKARVLGARSGEKPRGLGDATDNCRQSKSTFMDYACAADARLEQAMTESAILQGSALMDSILAVRDLLRSTQLHLHVGTTTWWSDR